MAGHEVIHLLPSSAEVKNEWSHTCTPPVCLHVILQYFQIAIILISVVFYKDFTTVTMIALKKKPQVTKCSDHHIISLIAHTAKIVASVLRRRIARKIEDVLGEDQFGFRRGKVTRDAIGMLRISE